VSEERKLEEERNEQMKAELKKNYEQRMMKRSQGSAVMGG